MLNVALCTGKGRAPPLFLCGDGFLVLGSVWCPRTCW